MRVRKGSARPHRCGNTHPRGDTRREDLNSFVEHELEEMGRSINTAWVRMVRRANDSSLRDPTGRDTPSGVTRAQSGCVQQYANHQIVPGFVRIKELREMGEKEAEELRRFNQQTATLSSGGMCAPPRRRARALGWMRLDNAMPCKRHKCLTTRPRPCARLAEPAS